LGKDLSASAAVVPQFVSIGARGTDQLTTSFGPAVELALAYGLSDFLAVGGALHAQLRPSAHIANIEVELPAGGFSQFGSLYQDTAGIIVGPMAQLRLLTFEKRLTPFARLDVGAGHFALYNIELISNRQALVLPRTSEWALSARAMLGIEYALSNRWSLTGGAAYRASSSRWVVQQVEFPLAVAFKWR
jgi:hypothetical protein